MAKAKAIHRRERRGRREKTKKNFSVPLRFSVVENAVQPLTDESKTIWGGAS
jgi:hypothetical protein